MWSAGNDYVDATPHAYNGKVEIQNPELCDEILGYIQNGFIRPEAMPSEKVCEHIKQTLMDDLNEYYGLASTSMNENGVFHPLIRGPVYKLDISGGKFNRSLVFLVKIESIFVLTYYSSK